MELFLAFGITILIVLFGGLFGSLLKRYGSNGSGGGADDGSYNG